MSDLTVRLAEPGDAERMAEIDRTCFAAPWSEDAFRTELENNAAALYLVGDIEGEVAGYAGLWWVGDEGHITNVAMDPEYRGLGVATCILDCLIDYCESEGMTSFTLEVRPSNARAIALYEKFAFVPVGRRPRYYEDNGEDALIMWRVTDEDGIPVLDEGGVREIMKQRGKL